MIRVSIALAILSLDYTVAGTSVYAAPARAAPNYPAAVPQVCEALACLIDLSLDGPASAHSRNKVSVCAAVAAAIHTKMAERLANDKKAAAKPQSSLANQKIEDDFAAIVAKYQLQIVAEADAVARRYGGPEDLSDILMAYAEQLASDDLARLQLGMLIDIADLCLNSPVTAVSSARIE